MTHLTSTFSGDRIDTLCGIGVPREFAVRDRPDNETRKIEYTHHPLRADCPECISKHIDTLCGIGQV